jgi:hypothetical protein
MAAREHDVLGLDVAVDDPARMCVAERLGDLARDLKRVLERHLLLALRRSAKGFALDVGMT